MSLSRKTVNAVMRSCFRYFDWGWRETSFKVESGKLTDSAGEAAGEYEWVAVTGSLLHDGVWELGADGAMKEIPQGDVGEVFTGKVYFLSPPISFLELCEKIEDFIDENPVSAADTVRIGQYSESGSRSWQKAYEKDLLMYMGNPLSCEIRV